MHSEDATTQADTIPGAAIGAERANLTGVQLLNPSGVCALTQANPSSQSVLARFREAKR